MNHTSKRQRSDRLGLSGEGPVRSITSSHNPADSSRAELFDALLLGSRTQMRTLSQLIVNTADSELIQRWLTTASSLGFVRASSPWQRLPAALLLHVLRHLEGADQLCGVHLVCKHWANIGREAGLFHVYFSGRRLRALQTDDWTRVSAPKMNNVMSAAVAMWAPRDGSLEDLWIGVLCVLLLVCVAVCVLFVVVYCFICFRLCFLCCDALVYCALAATLLVCLFSDFHVCVAVLLCVSVDPGPLDYLAETFRLPSLTKITLTGFYTHV